MYSKIGAAITATRFSVLPSILCAVLLLSPWEPTAAAPGDSARIEAGLAQARRALAEYHLTLPANDNAVAYAQEVLDLAPGHPEALEILRQVVARYETLGQSVVDRAEALRRTELEKAKVYQERGGRIAEHYRLPDSGLRRLQEQLAAQPKARTPDRSVAVTEPQTSAREVLDKVAAGYVGRGEAALSNGNVAEAKRYQDLAQELVSTYTLPATGLQALTAHLASVEGSKAGVTEKETKQEKGSTAAPGAGTSPAIFLPPAF